MRATDTCLPRRRFDELGIGDVLAAGPVLPVVVLHDVAAAVPLADALSNGGITAVEITLRTECALQAVAAIAKECSQMIVGVGSVRSPQHVAQATRAGARFLVTPGSPPGLLAACEESGLPTLPGAATVTEMLALVERGYTTVKFFPAQQLGGVATLRAVGGPLPDLQICPTGGITEQLTPSYLALPTVACVGASWVTPADALRDGDWQRIRGLARRTQGLTDHLNE